MSDPYLGESLGALARFFVADGTFEETLRRVSELTVRAVPPTEFVGLTMIVEGQQRTAVFTDVASPEIDQAQYDTGEGPCLAAFDTGEVHIIQSTKDEPRWQAFCAAAAAHGIGSTMSLPMVVAHEAVGAMNLYARPERGFGDAERETATQFAAQAAMVLVNAQAYWDARNLSEGLRESMKTRAVIEQAKGILMGAQRVDEAKAFAMLVSASQRENAKLRDIAQRIVSTVTDISPLPDPTERGEDRRGGS